MICMVLSWDSPRSVGNPAEPLRLTRFDILLPLLLEIHPQILVGLTSGLARVMASVRLDILTLPASVAS